MYTAAQMLMVGFGDVEPDLPQSKYWFFKAAENGMTDAMRMFDEKFPKDELERQLAAEKKK